MKGNHGDPVICGCASCRGFAPEVDRKYIVPINLRRREK